MDTNQKTSPESFQITGNWDAQSKKLKEQFPLLTDSDLKCEPGKETEMLARVESRLNKKREEVISLIRKGQPAVV